MSRVYSALTGATRPAGTAVLDEPDDGVWENSEEPVAVIATMDDAPFIEIGGPAGPVFSAGLSVPTPPRATGEPRPAPQPLPKVDEPTRTFPRLAPTPTAHLSVRFHDVAPRSGAARIVAGPDASLVAFHLPEHPVSGEYRALRDAIRQQWPDAPSHLLMLTAAATESGTTTVLLNLAITLANKARGRVLVVDANLKRPAVAAKLGIKTGPGVAEVLTNRVPLTLAIQPTGVDRLDALAAGDTNHAAAAALGREFPRMLAQLRHWYDVVLVDAGTWGAMPELDGTCPGADAVYLVTRDTQVEQPEFIAVRGWVKELGGLLRGYVTTRV